MKGLIIGAGIAAWPPCRAAARGDRGRRVRTPGRSVGDPDRRRHHRVGERHARAEELDLAEATQQVGLRVTRAENCTADGALLFEIPVAEFEQQLGAPTVTISRSNLHPVLEHGLGADRIQVNKECTGFEQDATGVTAQVPADGSTARGEFLLPPTDATRVGVRNWAAQTGTFRRTRAGRTTAGPSRRTTRSTRTAVPDHHPPGLAGGLPVPHGPTERVLGGGCLGPPRYPRPRVLPGQQGVHRRVGPRLGRAGSVRWRCGQPTPTTLQSATCTAASRCRAGARAGHAARRFGASNDDHARSGRVHRDRGRAHPRAKPAGSDWMSWPRCGCTKRTRLSAPPTG